MIKTKLSLRDFGARASLRTVAVGVTKVGVQIAVLWVIFALSNSLVARLSCGSPGTSSVSPFFSCSSALGS